MFYILLLDQVISTAETEVEARRVASEYTENRLLPASMRLYLTLVEIKKTQYICCLPGKTFAADNISRLSELIEGMGNG